MSGERIGYDELLYNRVEQLKVIDERLEKIVKKLSSGGYPAFEIRQLRWEIADMIYKAESEHTAF